MALNWIVCVSPPPLHPIDDRENQANTASDSVTDTPVVADQLHGIQVIVPQGTADQTSTSSEQLANLQAPPTPSEQSTNLRHLREMIKHHTLSLRPLCRLRQLMCHKTVQ